MDKVGPVRIGLFVGSGLFVLGLLGGCHKSSGGGAPAVSFTFASGAATLVESDGPTSLQVVLHTTLPALAQDASVEVYDLGTGTATSGSDYTAFSTQMITFLAGSIDGMTQAVMLEPLDDADVDAPTETVRLSMQNAVGGSPYGTAQLTATILDDDGAPLFTASAGPTGTENTLAYDTLVSLGSQSVDAGPNAGTLVRVTNGGGASMAMGTPSLAGSHPNDFAVEIESSSAPALGLMSQLGMTEVPALMVAAENDTGPGLGAHLDAQAVERMSALERVALHDFVLPDLGPVTLELERRPLPLTADAKLVVDGQEVAGGVRALVGDLQIWRGAVAGMPGSRVFLAFSGNGAQGFLELPYAPDRLVHVTTDAAGQVRLLGDPELAAFGLGLPQDFCAGERFVPGQPLRQQLGDPDAPSTGALTVSDCRLALETDFQFFQAFNSSVLLTNYVTGLIGAVSDQYFTDVQTTLSIAYLGIHTTSNDGWTTQETGGANAGDLLDEFQATWGSSWPAQADLAHFLSGDTLGGGVAYVDVLCNPSFGFGVSANLTGTIDWSTWTGQAAGFTWDFVVTAHELGHNFGSLHTHDYCPPLDQCYANCSGPTACTRGTLMSYCHTCAGLANIDLYFHPVTAEIMRENVNASCLDDAALSAGDFIQYRVRFNPLTTMGARSATLEFTHDASNVAQPFRVQLSGTAN